jgi:hypothetical protein
MEIRMGPLPTRGDVPPAPDAGTVAAGVAVGVGVGVGVAVGVGSDAVVMQVDALMV